MIKTLFKWLFRLGLLLAVLAVGLVLAKDAILRAVVERQIRAATGLDARIGRVHVGLLTPVVTVEDFRLFNPPAFGGTPFLTMPELHVEYDAGALRNRQLRVRVLRCNLAEFNIVRNELGQTNLAALFPQKKAAAGGGGGGGPPRPAGTPGLQFTGIEVLNLTLGKVRFVDLGDPTRNRELNLGLQNQVFRNLQNEGDLYGVVIYTMVRSGVLFAGKPEDFRINLFGSAGGGWLRGLRHLLPLF